MLDLNDPNATHVFEASRIEDVIRVHLVSWREQTGEALSQMAVNDIRTSIASLQALNFCHFEASAGIAQTLDGLMSAVLTGDAESSWQAFLQLAETRGQNFGTWAI